MTTRIGRLVAGCALLALAACGGGGGGAAPQPIAPPPVAPTPPPPTPPSPPFTGSPNDTDLYRRSNGASQAGGVAALDRGATGAGVTVAVIDSGVTELAQPFFAGRISPASRDLVGTRGIVDGSTETHGTAVASIIAASRDSPIIQGIAPLATLLVLRGDQPGTCPKCSYADNTLALGINAATDAGARVVNLSLGGSANDPPLDNAVARATSAGLVIVLAAGNDAAANPDASATDALFEARAPGAVIIAGAVDGFGNIADFSNRAGASADNYLTALGVRVRAPGSNNDTYLYSGTSFSTPLISGAVALVAQAFPNLTGRQIADILFRTATDRGDPGTDAVYGRGELNLTRAFQPVGASALAATREPVSLGVNGVTGGALGDATGLKTGLAGTVILDEYGRAFRADLGRTLRAPGVPGLAGALLVRSGVAGLATAGASLSFNVGTAAGARPWLGLAQAGLDATGPATDLRAATFAARLGRGALAFGTGQALATIAGADPGAGAFLLAPGAGFTRDPARRAAALALTQPLGRWTLSMGAGTSAGFGLGPVGGVRASEWRVGAARALGPARLGLAVSQRDERGGLLGAALAPALGIAAARTRFLDVDARLPLGRWTLAAAARHGWTDTVIGGGAITRVRGLTAVGWRFDAERAGLFTPSDRLALRLARPLRAETGTATLTLADGYDYATRTAAVADRLAGLAPSGRETDAELAYRAVFGWGTLGANLFVRDQPGHVASAPMDTGAALVLSAGF